MMSMGGTTRKGGFDMLLWQGVKENIVYVGKQLVSVNSAGHWPQQRLSVGLVRVLLPLVLFCVCLLL